MRNRVFSKYLDVSNKSKDIRKQNLIDDRINPKKWEYNVVYLGRNLHRATINTEDEELIAQRADSQFKEICFNISRGLGDYPLALDIQNFYWYIAAYPDVINFFYPQLDMTLDDAQRIADLEKRTKLSNEFLDDFESSFKTKSTSTLEYFLGLKDYYKRNHKLVMAKKI